MALQKTINYKGLQLENAYCKITNLQGNKDKIYYEISTFINKDLSESTINRIVSFNYDFVPTDDVRWDKQCYENAKTQTDFTGAIDVLDEGQTA